MLQQTPEEAETYGGVAGAAYDPFYHQPCDSLTPVENGADAALYAKLDAQYDLVHGCPPGAGRWRGPRALHTFAQTTSAVNGTTRGAAHIVTDLAFQGHHTRK